MTPDRQDKAIAALRTKGVNRPCPRCGAPKFSVVGETSISLQENPSVFSVGGPSIPTVLVACDNCGYITQHAQVSLGLVPGGAQ